MTECSEEVSDGRMVRVVLWLVVEVVWSYGYEVWKPVDQTQIVSLLISLWLLFTCNLLVLQVSN